MNYVQNWVTPSSALRVGESSAGTSNVAKVTFAAKDTPAVLKEPPQIQVTPTTKDRRGSKSGTENLQREFLSTVLG